MKLSLPTMPSMEPVNNAARYAANNTVAGAREFVRVGSQTAKAYVALVQTVALAVLTAISAPVLYFASTARLEALKGKTVESFENFKAEARAIVYKPVAAQIATPAATASTVNFRKVADKVVAGGRKAADAVIAGGRKAADVAIANKKQLAAAAIITSTAAAVYFLGVPTAVREPIARIAREVPAALNTTYTEVATKATELATSIPAAVNATYTELATSVPSALNTTYTGIANSVSGALNATLSKLV